MIKFKKGNLFDNYSIPGVIVHGANAQGVMGSGFAKQFKLAFPDAYLDYINAPQYYLGDLIVTKYSGLLVCSAITQEYYGRSKSTTYVSYKAVAGSMQKVAELAGDVPIFIPFIGGGLANGNRAILLDIFENVFEKSDVTIFTLE